VPWRRSWPGSWRGPRITVEAQPLQARLCASRASRMANTSVQGRLVGATHVSGRAGQCASSGAYVKPSFPWAGAGSAPAPSMRAEGNTLG
jgi:hypothetical protein